MRTDFVLNKLLSCYINILSCKVCTISVPISSPQFALIRYITVNTKREQTAESGSPLPSFIPPQRGILF